MSELTTAILNKEPGIGAIGTNVLGGVVEPLPMAVRLPFIKALIAEDDGNTVEAAEWLDKAIVAEEKAALVAKK